MANEDRYTDQRPQDSRKRIDGVDIMTCTKCDNTFFEPVTFNQLRTDAMVAPDRSAVILTTLVMYRCGKCNLLQDHPMLSIADDAVRKTHDAFNREAKGDSDIPFTEKWKDRQNTFRSQEEIVKAQMEQDEKSSVS